MAFWHFNTVPSSPFDGTATTEGAFTTIWLPSPYDWWVVGGRKSASSYANSVATTPDGTTYTTRGNPFGSGGATVGLGYGPGIDTLVACGGGGGTTNSLAYSTDGGATWTGAGNPASNGGSIADAASGNVAWNGSMFVAVGGCNDLTLGTPVVTSPDGITWTQQDLSALAISNVSLGSIAWSPTLGLWVAGGVYVVGGNNTTILTSPDAVTWTVQSTPFDVANNFQITSDSVLWSGNLGMFLAMGSAEFDGHVQDRWTAVSSTDGVTWVSIPSLSLGTPGPEGFLVCPFEADSGYAYTFGQDFSFGGNELLIGNASSWTNGANIINGPRIFTAAYSPALNQILAGGIAPGFGGGGTHAMFLTTVNPFSPVFATLPIASPVAMPYLHARFETI